MIITSNQTKFILTKMKMNKYMISLMTKSSTTNPTTNPSLKIMIMIMMMTNIPKNILDSKKLKKSSKKKTKKPKKHRIPISMIFMTMSPIMMKSKKSKRLRKRKRLMTSSLNGQKYKPNSWSILSKVASKWTKIWI